MILLRKFYGIRIAIIAALILLLLAPSVFASQLDDKRRELKDIDARIKATKGKRNAATQRQAHVSQQIQQSTQKMVGIQKKLNQTQTELNDVIAKKRQTEAKLGETQKLLDETQAKLAEAKERLALRRDVFDTRLGSLYKNGRQGALVALLGSDDFSDFIARVEFLNMIAEHDGKIVLDMKQLTATIGEEVAELEAAKKAINQQRLNLVAEKKRIDELMESVIAQQEELEDEMARQQRLYAELEREKERLARAEGALKASSSKVAKQIKELERPKSGVTRGSGKAPSSRRELQALAAKIAAKYGIPTKLFFGLITQESGWNYRAVSRAGAIGLTQVMPFNVVAMGYGMSEFKSSPELQLEAGARYLSQQYKTFGRWDYALAAYNAGPGAVMRYGGIPPYSETRGYVRNIMRMAG